MHIVYFYMKLAPSSILVTLRHWVHETPSSLVVAMGAMVGDTEKIGEGMVMGDGDQHREGTRRDGHGELHGFATPYCMS